MTINWILIATFIVEVALCCVWYFRTEWKHDRQYFIVRKDDNG